ncbi:MAG TPA: hypothetical protein VHX61_19590 [Rhizomicrobium sp.]|jgi:hypothetical protein|nr:hypothetical protein [Rhizomicrobium sp.]
MSGASDRLRRRWPRVAAAAVLVLACAASLALNWPGQLSYDSVVQLHDGRTGHYNPWHPPVMAWMLGIADSILPGTGLFILFDSVLLFAGLLSLLWLARRVSWAAAIAAAICSALPQLVLYQGIVWKDVLFADAAVAGFVLLAHAAAQWPRNGLRWLLICSGVLFLALATLARQNGAIALVLGVAALVIIARKQGLRWRGALVCGIAAGTFAIGVVAIAGMALAARSTGVSGPAGQVKLLQLYDLIGEVKTDPALKLETLTRANPDLVQLMRSDGVRLYTPTRNDTLVGSPDLQNEFADTGPAAISSQWLEVLLHHPLDYLRVRARVFDRVFLTPGLRQCAPYYTGIAGPPQYLKELGLKRRFRPQDAALGNYAALFVSTPVYSHAAWAALALALLVFLVRRRGPADIAIASLLAAALIFVSSFFVISIACDYRYLLFLDLSAMTALFYCAATWREGQDSA